MSDEIKEILDYLKDSQYIPSDDNRTYKLLDRDDTRHLLDCITNLQQENQDYKSRVEKAVEYIKEEFDRTGVCVSGSDLPYSYIEDLLNILQGAEDSNLQDQ